MKKKIRRQIMEGSRVIALTVKNIGPDVVSAYPITPQTHIVEDLAKFKADGEANYEYLRAESEFAAASIVAGASAAGARAYTASSSQGLLLMTEVLYNIAGLRLPIVLTCANRAVSSPINIWNDQQDAVTMRDSGWIMLYAENHQEAVAQHIMAFKIAEKTKIPVMVNVDGFILTHTYEPVVIPSAEEIKKYLPAFTPKKDEYLNIENPLTFGSFAQPKHYMEIREDLQKDILASADLIKKEYEIFKRTVKIAETKEKNVLIDNGLVEYSGPKNPKTVIIAMGSVIGTIKEAFPLSYLGEGARGRGLTKRGAGGKVGVLKIKCFRPFPEKEVLKIISQAKNIAVLDKSISLGEIGPLATAVRTAGQGIIKPRIQSFIAGLGGRDITREIVRKMIKEAAKNHPQAKFFK